ncbi:hypothetical protein [Spirosoma pomorum]
MNWLRQGLIDEFGEHGYQLEMQRCKAIIQVIPPLPGMNYLELTDAFLHPKIDRQETSEDAKAVAKAIFGLAAVELMGEDKFLEWAQSANHDH